MHSPTRPTHPTSCTHPPYPPHALTLCPQNVRAYFEMRWNDSSGAGGGGGGGGGGAGSGVLALDGMQDQGRGEEGPGTSARASARPSSRARTPGSPVAGGPGGTREGTASTRAHSALGHTHTQGHVTFAVSAGSGVHHREACGGCYQHGINLCGADATLQLEGFEGELEEGGGVGGACGV
jgi:hypothetical protein